MIYRYVYYDGLKYEETKQFYSDAVIIFLQVSEVAL